MRTTLRVDDELLEELKAQARSRNMSLTRLLNQTLRAGMMPAARRAAKRRRYRERPRAMGTPAVDLHKALALAAALEDAEIARELALRK